MLRPKEAEKELEKANELNPGPWFNHSLSAGRNAKIIAEHTNNLDKDKAYVLGVMHDIGRRVGPTGIMHTLDGYNYLMNMNEPEIARICLTHSFPNKNINNFASEYDCTDEQKNFIKNFITEVEYDDYDKLIQLCDAITLPSGACIIEKRLFDVSLRHGVNDSTVEKWKSFLEIKKYFDEKCSCNIYSFLPNVVENSFQNLI